MTERLKTVTDHILDAQAALDHELVAGAELAQARECLERALDAINLARCEAQTALDKF